MLSDLLSRVRNSEIEEIEEVIKDWLRTALGRSGVCDAQGFSVP